MSYRRRNAYSSYYGSRGGSRGPADWLGLLALVCMLVCSVILLVRVLDAGVLTTALTVVFILVLVLLNGLHAFVQLPVRRSVAGKLVCSVVALALSAAMIFTSTAAGSFMKFLSNITSGGSAKTTVSVVVRADDKAETVNDTFGYTYGILEAMDRENTDALLSHIEDGLGQVQTETFGTLPQLADALLNKQVDAIILTGGLAREIALKNGIDPRRSASLLDIFSCVFQGLIPWAAQLLLAGSLAKISPLEITINNWYCMLLAVAGILAIILGLPRIKARSTEA